MLFLISGIGILILIALLGIFCFLAQLDEQVRGIKNKEWDTYSKIEKLEKFDKEVNEILKIHSSSNPYFGFQSRSKLLDSMAKVLELEWKESRTQESGFEKKIQPKGKKK